MSVEHEWSGGVFRSALKLLASMNFCEWSKHAQIGAAVLIYLQGIAVPMWNYEEGKRAGSVNGVLATHNAEVSDLHAYVSIGGVAAYTLFIVYERNVGPEIGSEVTVDGKSKKIKTWRDRQNSPGPSLLVRTLFNLAAGIGLLVLQPTVLAGGATTLVGLVSLGAFLKKEKSTCYTAEQNPVPFLSMFAKCCAKKSEDHDTKAEAADEEHAKEMEPSWLRRQQQMDRLGKVVFMIVYLALNAFLFIEARPAAISRTALCGARS